MPALGGRRWTVQADVIGPTDLHLALPGRTRITDDAFVQKMRREAERAIYLAMAQAGERVDREHQARALKLGVLLPTPKRQLIGWRPPRAENAAPAGELRDVGRDAILVADDLTPSDAQLLAHAAKRSHLATRLYAEHRELRGYAWYDALERVRGFRIEAETGPETWTRTTGSEPDTPEPEGRPDRITLVLRTERSGCEREIRIAAEVAFWADSNDLRNADEIPVTVSRDATIDRAPLRELLEAAFFVPVDGDSYDAQRDGFRQAAEARAADVLDGRNEAVRALLDHLARRHLRPAAAGHQVAIRIGTDGEVHVELGKASPSAG